MGNAVRAHVVQIGNSRGIRIPKVWIEQLDLVDWVEMAIQKDELIIRRPRRAREGWADEFRNMAAAGDDGLLDDTIPTTWEKREWQW
jgi:antitoxin MazE